jgi:hypothetical protein
MQMCPECHSDLVQPVEWEEQPGDGWSVELRCPECEWRGGGTYAQSDIDEYDRLLDEGMRSVIDDLRKLTRENMERDLEDLIKALDGDLVLPEDF